MDKYWHCTFTEAVCGTSTLVLLGENIFAGWTLIFHGPGAGPLWGPSTNWPARDHNEYIVNYTL